jgi:hypothetical protein
VAQLAAWTTGLLSFDDRGALGEQPTESPYATTDYVELANTRNDRDRRSDTPRSLETDRTSAERSRRDEE